MYDSPIPLALNSEVPRFCLNPFLTNKVDIRTILPGLMHSMASLLRKAKAAIPLSWKFNGEYDVRKIRFDSSFG